MIINYDEVREGDKLKVTYTVGGQHVTRIGVAHKVTPSNISARSEDGQHSNFVFPIWTDLKIELLHREINLPEPGTQILVKRKGSEVFETGIVLSDSKIMTFYYLYSTYGYVSSRNIDRSEIVEFKEIN